MSSAEHVADRDPATVPRGLEAALTEHVFSAWDQSFLATPAGEQGKRDVLIGRYVQAVRHAVPWLQRVTPLAELDVVELGCGSGSSTVAIAQHCRTVTGYDIDVASIRAASARCAAYGVTNVTAHAIEPASLLSAVRTGHRGAGMFVLYAVLEHQTYEERFDTLATLWDCLQAGGYLVVLETPNRLAWMDSHTAQLPFFHLLPDAVAFRYLDAVPRLPFREHMQQVLREHPDQASEARIRWGLGASFHEFQIALPEALGEVVVADGFEAEMVGMFASGPEEETLVRFFCTDLPEVPLGFARTVLSLVLRKPRSAADREAAAAFCRGRREERLRRPVPATATAMVADAPPLRTFLAGVRRWARAKMLGVG